MQRTTCFWAKKREKFKKTSKKQGCRQGLIRTLEQNNFNTLQERYKEIPGKFPQISKQSGGNTPSGSRRP
jgi:hypothetical protein